MPNSNHTRQLIVSLYPEEMADFEAIRDALHPEFKDHPKLNGNTPTVRDMIKIVKQVLEERKANE